ncbi:MAG: hypothetical protein QXN66_01890 [Thermoplasmatales archaeon]
MSERWGGYQSLYLEQILYEVYLHIDPARCIKAALPNWIERKDRVN